MWQYIPHIFLIGIFTGAFRDCLFLTKAHDKNILQKRVQFD